MKNFRIILLIFPLSLAAQESGKPAKTRKYNTDACPEWGSDPRAKSRAEYLQFLASEKAKQRSEYSQKQSETPADSTSSPEQRRMTSIIPSEEAKQNKTDEFYNRRRYNVVPVKAEIPKSPVPEDPAPEVSQKTEYIPASADSIPKTPNVEIQKTEENKQMDELKPEESSDKEKPADPVVSSDSGTKKIKKHRRFRLFHKNGVKKGRSKKTSCPSF